MFKKHKLPNGFLGAFDKQILEEGCRVQKSGIVIVIFQDSHQPSCSSQSGSTCCFQPSFHCSLDSAQNLVLVEELKRCVPDCSVYSLKKNQGPLPITALLFLASFNFFSHSFTPLVSNFEYPLGIQGNQRLEEAFFLQTRNGRHRKYEAGPSRSCLDQ